MASGKEMKAIITIAGAIDPSLAKSIEQATKSTSGLGTVFKVGGAVAAAGVAAATAAVVKFGSAAVEAASSYEQAFANTSTLIKATGEDLQAISDQILAVSTETGVAAEDLANSVYSAISAGIDEADAVEFAAKSAKLAAAGFTDTDTALTAVAKTLNAYGLDASHTDEIQKMLIQTQNLGITTVGELGASLAQVTPTAAAFGVSFDQVSAALATMTAQGTPTAQSTTQLNSMIAELGKSGTVASKNFARLTGDIKEGGLTFAEAMEQGWNLNDVLSLFDKEASATGKSMVDMFSSIEAGKAALSVWNGNFTENLKAMGTDADVVGEAYEKVTNTFEHQSQVLKNTWQNFKIQAGQAILPVINQIAQEALPAVQDAMQQVMPLIKDGIERVSPIIKDLASSLIPKIGTSVQALLPVIQQVFEWVVSSLPTIIDIAAGIGDMILPVVIGLIDMIMPVIQQLGEALAPVIMQIMSALQPLMQLIISTLMPALQQLITALLPVVVSIVSALSPVIGQILAILQPVIQFITEIIALVATVAAEIITALQPLIDVYLVYIENALTNLLQVVLDVINPIFDALKALINFVKDVFAGNWKAAWEDIKQYFVAVWSSLAGLIKAPFNAVIAVINGAISAINSLSVHIPEWVPVFGGQVFSLNLPEMPYLAKGGFTNGVSIAGEAGTEAVISFDPAVRKENLSYWAKAGKLLGANANAVDTVVANAQYGDKGGNYITFSPNVTIQGNADYDIVLQAIRDEEEEFMDMLAEFLARRQEAAYV